MVNPVGYLHAFIVRHAVCSDRGWRLRLGVFTKLTSVATQKVSAEAVGSNKCEIGKPVPFPFTDRGGSNKSFSCISKTGRITRAEFRHCVAWPEKVTAYLGCRLPILKIKLENRDFSLCVQYVLEAPGFDSTGLCSNACLAGDAEISSASLDAILFGCQKHHMRTFWLETTNLTGDKVCCRCDTYRRATAQIVVCMGNLSKRLSFYQRNEFWPERLLKTLGVCRNSKIAEKLYFHHAPSYVIKRHSRLRSYCVSSPSCSRRLHKGLLKQK